MTSSALLRAGDRPYRNFPQKIQHLPNILPTISYRLRQHSHRQRLNIDFLKCLLLRLSFRCNFWYRSKGFSSAPVPPPPALQPKIVPSLPLYISHRIQPTHNPHNFSEMAVVISRQKYSTFLLLVDLESSQLFLRLNELFDGVFGMALYLDQFSYIFCLHPSVPVRTATNPRPIPPTQCARTPSTPPSSARPFSTNELIYSELRPVFNLK